MNSLLAQWVVAEAFILGLFIGLVLGLAANLERIGRVARWQRAILEEGNAARAQCTAQLVAHHCPREGLMEIEAGAPCNWCGEVVQGGRQ